SPPGRESQAAKPGNTAKRRKKSPMETGKERSADVLGAGLARNPSFRGQNEQDYSHAKAQSKP
ncbi:MAG: hypothetical protein WD065_09610, partial [Planctomycetaceae bacterium]